MIQIIKKGKVDTYVAICPHCGCKFTYQEDDLYYIDYIKCPMEGCSNVISIYKRVLASSEDLKELNINAR